MLADRALIPLWRAPRLLQSLAVEPPLNIAFRKPLSDGRLDFLAGRVLRIETPGGGISFTVTGRCVRISGDMPDVTVRAGIADLAALAAGKADADTLFFQRRLLMTGDTELGLRFRNLLESLPPPWPIRELRRRSSTGRD